MRIYLIFIFSFVIQNVSIAQSKPDTEEIYFQWENNSIGAGDFPVVSSWTIGYSKIIAEYLGLSGQVHIMNYNGLHFELLDINGNELGDFPKSITSVQFRIGADLYLLREKRVDWKFVLGATIGYYKQNLWQGTYKTNRTTSGLTYISDINLRDSGFDGAAFGIELETQLLYKIGKVKIGPTISLGGASKETGFQSYGLFLVHALGKSTADN